MFINKKYKTSTTVQKPNMAQLNKQFIYIQ